MLWRPFRRILSKTLQGLGYEVKRLDSRSTVVGALQQAHLAGLAPATVIDVGAAWGQFTSTCRTVFPDARYVLVEALEEYRPKLEALMAGSTGMNYVIAAASARPGEVTLHVHSDLVGSSLFLEQEVGGVNGVPRVVPAVTLDSLVGERGLVAPYLLKLDVQGAELAALAGAANILPETEYVLLEVSLFEFFEGGPVLNQVVDFMHGKGFTAYDMIDPQYRPLDGALAQIDIAFVKERGLLRVAQAYATAEQRRTQFDRAARRR